MIQNIKMKFNQNKSSAKIRNKVQRTHWTEEQKLMLVKVYKKYPNNWNKIIQQIPGKTIQSCMYMSQRLKIRKRDQQKRIKNNYTKQEDKLIIETYKKFPENWNKITSYISYRTLQSIKARYKNLIGFDFKIAPRKWTIQEDYFFLKIVFILKFNWNDIAKLFQYCNQSSCYQRFRFFMIGVYPNQSHIWSQQQDIILLKLFEQLDQNWQSIAQRFDNMTPEICLKRFYKLRSEYLERNWSQSQIAELINRFNYYKGNWKDMSDNFKNFTIRDCYFQYHEQRHKKMFQNNLKIKQLIAKIKRESSTNKSWNFKEDQLLLELAYQYQFNWQIISSKFQNQRTGEDCNQRFSILQYIYKNNNQRVWKIEQEKQLVQLFQSNPYSWQTISNKFTKCTKYDCYIKFKRLMDHNQKFKQQVYSKFCSDFKILEVDQFTNNLISEFSKNICIEIQMLISVFQMYDNM